MSERERGRERALGNDKDIMSGRCWMVRLGRRREEDEQEEEENEEKE